jgi:hypothetical protein
LCIPVNPVVVETQAPRIDRIKSTSSIPRQTNRFFVALVDFAETFFALDQQYAATAAARSLAGGNTIAHDAC